jgi:hypothetical protein
MKSARSNYSFYQYKHDFSCYFHDFEKEFVLKTQFRTSE